MRISMKVAAIAFILPLFGCDLADRGARVDIRAVRDCAERHPPPPQANVDALGLMPVYLSHTADSDDEATRKWFADMDACTAGYKPAGDTAK